MALKARQALFLGMFGGALGALLSACVGMPDLHADTAAPAAGTNELDSPLPQGTKAFGIYQWDKETNYEFGLQKEIVNLGAQPGYAMYFVDLQMGFPADIVRFNEARNIKTIISQEICTYFRDGDGEVLDSILAGKHDAYFRRFAKEAKVFRQILYYRFGYEMNGDWVKWGERPETFVKAWRRVWTIFQQEKADNVQWVFSPNVIWDDRTVKKDLVPYYPGDKFVDVVGVDGYNFGDNHSRHHRWRSFHEVFQTSLDGLKEHFPEKPVWITEIGCANGPGKSEWIQEFLDYFNHNPDVNVFIWFNEDKQYAGEPNWRLDSDDDSLEKFRKWAISSHTITYFSLPGQDNASYRAPALPRGRLD